MCGIVGYTGNNNAIEVLVDGLSKLEYRGYDSAGVAIYNNNKVEVYKASGRLKNLQTKLDEIGVTSNNGIGHTRWATHGEPCDRNSHPHTSNDGKVSIVHNGIIENFKEIKDDLIEKGYRFESDTDTEVAVQLLGHIYKSKDNLIDAVIEMLNIVEGAYAFGIVSEDYPNQIISVRKESPLIVGLGEGENFIASDVPAILAHTRNIVFLDEKEIAILTPDEVKFIDYNKNTINKEVKHIEWDIDAAEKGGYDHFMLKEVNEQPKVVKDTISGRLLDKTIKLDDIKLTKEDLSKFNKIHIVACGTAYYAGCLGKTYINEFTGIPVFIEVASEYRYNDPIIDNKTLVIIISQSGETADTLAALKLAKSKGARILSVVNVVGSSIARESHDIFYTAAGPEISVASTKAYTSQVVALFLIALHMGVELKNISEEQYNTYKVELENLPNNIATAIQLSDEIKAIVEKNQNLKNAFYIGRGRDYLISLEGALKVKEIAYIHAESYAAGELKHGPIALLEKGSIILSSCTQEHLYEKTLSNLLECKARSAKVIIIATNNIDVSNVADDSIIIPNTISALAPIVANIPQQLFAYHMACSLGNDVDKPRNLAKSVTVE